MSQILIEQTFSQYSYDTELINITLECENLVDYTCTFQLKLRKIFVNSKFCVTVEEAGPLTEVCFVVLGSRPRTEYVYSDCPFVVWRGHPRTGCVYSADCPCFALLKLIYFLMCFWL